MYNIFWRTIDELKRSKMTKSELEKFLVNEGREIAWVNDIELFNNSRPNEGIIIRGDVVVPLIETSIKVTV